ncbi:MAG: hypothetical protein KC420_11560 [Myxococcales bacterium]|nr:hypothetical protein [Myxococcales bacterium]MCB9569694.1 hypothetical protein [Myxococcales bacterium]MCB9700499.1 hypothetical protein [Myxococcales bacterium]
MTPRLRVSALALALALIAACTPEGPDECEKGERFAAPGCDDPIDASVVVPAACYLPCADGKSCPEGTTCTLAYVDPCYQQSCLACGGTELLCVP